MLVQTTMVYTIRNNILDISFPMFIRPATRSLAPHALLHPHNSVLAYSYPLPPPPLCSCGTKMEQAFFYYLNNIELDICSKSN